MNIEIILYDKYNKTDKCNSAYLNILAEEVEKQRANYGVLVNRFGTVGGGVCPAYSSGRKTDHRHVRQVFEHKYRNAWFCFGVFEIDLNI